jgi:hypothetical protein
VHGLIGADGFLFLALAFFVLLLAFRLIPNGKRALLGNVLLRLLMLTAPTTADALRGRDSISGPD